MKQSKRYLKKVFMKIQMKSGPSNIVLICNVYYQHSITCSKSTIETQARNKSCKVC